MHMNLGHRILQIIEIEVKLLECAVLNTCFLALLIAHICHEVVPLKF